VKCYYFFIRYDHIQILQKFALRKFVHILVKLVITNVFIALDNLELNSLFGLFTHKTVLICNVIMQTSSEQKIAKTNKSRP
jgi:hypothetical protein